MSRPLWVAKTGLDAQQTRMSVIANNLANVSTTGYKRSRGVFADLLYQNVRQPGGTSSQDSQLPSGLMLGTGVRVVATEKNFAQGNIFQTQNDLDIAIQGRGFLQMQQPNGDIAYTRDGSFQRNAEGTIVNAEGLVLQPGLTIPDGVVSLSIGNDGTVSAVIAGTATPTSLGTIQLSDFINPAGLQPVGKNLFIETAASGSPQSANPGQDGLGTLVQGAIESSNVNVVEEMVNMIETQRAYEMNSKAIATTDEMLRFITNNL